MTNLKELPILMLGVTVLHEVNMPINHRGYFIKPPTNRDPEERKKYGPKGLYLESDVSPHSVVSQRLYEIQNPLLEDVPDDDLFRDNAPRFYNISRYDIREEQKARNLI